MTRSVTDAIFASSQRSPGLLPFPVRNSPTRSLSLQFNSSAASLHSHVLLPSVFVLHVLEPQPIPTHVRQASVTAAYRSQATGSALRHPLFRRHVRPMHRLGGYRSSSCSEGQSSKEMDTKESLQNAGEGQDRGCPSTGHETHSSGNRRETESYVRADETSPLLLKQTCHLPPFSHRRIQRLPGTHDSAHVSYAWNDPAAPTISPNNRHMEINR